MGGRESRFSRLHVQRDGSEEASKKEASSDRLHFLTYEELKKMICEAPPGSVRVRMYLATGSSLQDVLLDTTLRGLFYQGTESDKNLATEYFLDKTTIDDKDHQITGQFFTCVIPSASLWIPCEPTDGDGNYLATFKNEDNPKYWTFKEDPNNSSFYAIYTKQKKCDASAAESELPTVEQDTTEGEGVSSQELSDNAMLTISLVTKVVDGVEPPRTNTIVGNESKKNYIFDVRFTAVGMVPILKRPLKGPLSTNQESQPPTTSESSEKLTTPSNAQTDEEGSGPTDSTTG